MSRRGRRAAPPKPPPPPAMPRIPPIKSPRVKKRLQGMQLQRRIIGRQIANPSQLKLQRDLNFPQCQCLETIRRDWRPSGHIIRPGRNPYEEGT